MKTWSVWVECAEEGADFDPATINERVEGLLYLLEDFSPSVSECPEDPQGVPRFGATLAVDAYTAIEAGREAVELIRGAIKRLDLPDFPEVKVEITEWTFFERELEQPTYPAVLGVSELAGMLNVSRQRASELAHSSGFAKPFAELASGPVWLETSVKRFVRDWERKPGRPRKVATT